MYPIEVLDDSNYPIIQAAKEDDSTLVSKLEQENNEFGGDCCGVFILASSIILIIVTFPVSIFMCIRVIHEYERAVIFRLGRVMKSNGPGMFFVVPCIDHVSLQGLEKNWNFFWKINRQ
jgi:lipopolysaccharide/colanic/teichoic acid biosynthesis glycosyltransferase